MKMNIDIKFRGRDVITGNWAYGYYYPSKGHAIIRDEKDYECIVLKKTVGQFINIKDKIGEEIYHGDILESPFNELFVVKWSNGRWVFGTSEKAKTGKEFDFLGAIDEYKVVVGNIYENPELCTK